MWNEGMVAFVFYSVQYVSCDEYIPKLDAFC